MNHSRHQVRKTANNMSLLADYIETDVPEANIYMGLYRSNDLRAPQEFYNKSECGSAGCALGWSPFVPSMPALDLHFGEPEYTYEEDEDGNQPKPELDYENYGKEYYPALYGFGPNGDLNYVNQDWSEVFSTSLSSDKKSVIQRLRAKSKELHETAQNMPD